MDDLVNGDYFQRTLRSVVVRSQNARFLRGWKTTLGLQTGKYKFGMLSRCARLSLLGLVGEADCADSGLPSSRGTARCACNRGLTWSHAIRKLSCQMNQTPELTAKLYEWVDASHLIKGARLPSVRQLAEEWGVGRMALNRAVTEWVGSGILARNGNRYFLGDLSSADALVPPLDLLVERWSDAGAVERIARHWKIEVRTHRSAGPEDRRAQLLDLLESDRPSSGVLVYGEQWPFELAALEQKGIPVVVFGARSVRHSHVAHDPGPRVELALSHLMDLGHRELAFIIPPPDLNFDLQHEEVERSFIAACAQHGLKSSTERVFTAAADIPEMRRCWQYISHRHPEVTAVVCEQIELAEALIRIVRADGVPVPEKLSVMSLQRDTARSGLDTPVTGIRHDHRKLLELAAFLLMDDIESERTARATPVRHAVLCQPRLFIGETTGAPPTLPAPIAHRSQKRDPLSPSEQPSPSAEWPEDLEERVALVEKMNRTRFKDVPQVKEAYHTIDLRSFALRKLTSYYGWMGQLPLLHFPPGKREIHGVPCEILQRAVVLRSRFARTCEGRPLPETLTIPVDREVGGLFILHTGGWLKHHESIGAYDFHVSRKNVLSEEIVAYGTGVQTKAEAARRAVMSIVQDWHPSTPIFSSARVKPFLVTRDGDPLRYLRCLYLFHWKNPEPAKRLESLTLRTYHPELRATLAVLAITAYDPQ